MVMMPATPDAAMPIEDPAADVVETTGDLSRGYSIGLSVLADGTFKVGVPGPLEVEEAGGEGEEFTSVGEALKAVLATIKENPVGGTDQANFEAGYGAG